MDEHNVLNETSILRDLLSRDNLFEIITNGRTFYIQVGF